MRKWTITAIVLVVFGVGNLGFVVWSKYHHVGQVAADQKRLEQAWELNLGEKVGTIGASGLVEPPKALPGAAIARITVPSLGQSWIVVQGTSPADIATSPGHYLFSTMPGQIGNFAVAGHREPGIFWDLDKVKKGDLIEVETRTSSFTYVVTRNMITSPQSWAEVSATPPGFGKGTKILTLTTCNPRYDNYERLVIHAVIQG